MTIFLQSVFVVFCAAIVAQFFLLALLPFLERRMLDHPNFRSSHVKPTPRGAGVSFVLISFFASAIELIFNLNLNLGFLPSLSPVLFAAPLAFVGFLDDSLSLPAVLRYLCQIFTAFIIVINSSLFSASGINLVLFCLLVIAVTAVINFINFMDGLDGLVAGCMALVISAAAIRLAAPWPIWALVGAILCFLVWNWSPSKVFMGDVGSTFLGAVFAGLVLQASSWLEALCCLLVATPLLGDACICVIRRLLVGQRVFQAHRLHLFQRLHQAGWPHARVSFTYISATAVLALALLVGDWPWVFGLAVVELLVGVWLDQRVAVPFAVVSKN